MCGIAGFVASHGARADFEKLEKMIHMIGHRGPDGEGIYSSGEVGLAHTRLSIIDPEGGHQPMSSNDGRFWITFNGEIYNHPELREGLALKGHRFRTRSDTEVILHLYQEMGEECVRELNGQWAFAIWDTQAHKLFLSRDRLGVRPLFYSQTSDGFWFASEIKAFKPLDISFELDLQALDQIFTYWVTLPPRTAFRGISQLLPGHSLTLEDGRISTREYWKPEYAPADSRTADERTLTEGLLELLLDATRIRLRADVPVGAYLSGGIDSTLITALTQSFARDRLQTFSIRFDDSQFDESCYQAEASTYIGTRHADTCCSSADIARAFPLVVWHAEQPLLRAAPAPMFLLSELVRRSGYKVVLTGEGADETLGGYDLYKETKIRQFCARLPTSQWRPLLLKRLYPYLQGMQSQPTSYLKSFFHSSADEIKDPYFSHRPRWNLTARLKTLFSDAVRAELSTCPGTVDLEDQIPQDFSRWKPFNRAEYLETRYLLPGYILSSQGDRMAMAHGVEARCPFLDHRLVEYAANLPPNFKMKALDEKHLLKQAAEGRIPESIRKRAKRPYRAPEGKMFLQALSSDVRDFLSSDCVRRWGIFNYQGVEALIAKCESGRAFSVKDNMGMVGILSSQILLDQFVGNGAPGPRSHVMAATDAERLSRAC